MSEDFGQVPAFVEAEDDGFDIHQQMEAAKAEGQPRPFHVKDAAGRPTFYGPPDDRKPVRIFVVGSHSPRYRAKVREQDREKIGQGTFTMEHAKDRALELAAHATVGWEGMMSGGKPVSFNAANVLAVYRGCPWLLKDAQDTIEDHAGFFESPSREP